MPLSKIYLIELQYFGAPLARLLVVHIGQIAQPLGRLLCRQVSLGIGQHLVAEADHELFDSGRAQTRWVVQRVQLPVVACPAVWPRGRPREIPLIRALLAHSKAKFNISPGRWQHVWLVAIVPPERWGKMDRNDCHTAWGTLRH
jgi:hypothetical protein